MRSVVVVLSPALVLAAAAPAEAPPPASQPSTAPPATGTPPVTAGPESSKPRFALQADKGFFDDPLAFDEGARRLAVIRTDSASFARIEILDVEGGGQAQRSFEIGNPGQSFEQIHFADDGAGIVLVSRDPVSGKRSAQFFDAAGKPAGLAGPYTEIAPSMLGVKRVLIGVARKTDAKGSTINTLSAHRLDGLARIGKARAHKLGPQGEIKGHELRALSWFDGFSKAHVLRAGRYDKEKDFRQPDRAAVFDALQGTVTSETEIGDVYAFAHVTKLRAERPNRTVFAVLADGESGLDLVDAGGARTPLPVAAPFHLYESRSVREQEGPEAGRFYFSLTVDALNRDAVARQKADKPYLDIYATDLGGKDTAPGTTLRAHIPVDDRPTVWVAGYGRAAVLKKHKGFSRGGRDLEVHDLK